MTANAGAQAAGQKTPEEFKLKEIGNLLFNLRLRPYLIDETDTQKKCIEYLEYLFNKQRELLGVTRESRNDEAPERRRNEMKEEAK